MTLDEYGYEHSGEAHYGHRGAECYRDRQQGYRLSAPAHMVKVDEFGYQHLIHSGMHVGHPPIICKRARELGRRVTAADFPPPKQPSESSPESVSNRGLPVWAMVLIVVGSVAAAALTIGLIATVVKTRRHRKAHAVAKPLPNRRTPKARR